MTNIMRNKSNGPKEEKGHVGLNKKTVIVCWRPMECVSSA